MALPFEKPGDLIELEPKVLKLLRKYHLDRYFTVEDLELMAYRCPKGKEFKVFDPVVSHLKSPQEIEEVMMLLHNELWNHTPLKILNGRSPHQMLSEYSHPMSKKDAGDWLKVSDLLLSIQADFQTRVYKAVKFFGQKDKEEVYSYSHFLFQRYLYSALEERPGAPSWQDIILEESKRLKVKVPKGKQISIFVYRTPKQNPPPNKQMRMSIGLVGWNEFPIVSDLNGGSQNDQYFRGDGFYLYLLEKLSDVGAAEPEKFTRLFLSVNLHRWLEVNPILAQAYRFEDWFDFWWNLLILSGNDWCITDDIFDSVIARLSSTGIETNHLLKKIGSSRRGYSPPKSDGEFLQEMMLYRIGIEYCLYFLTPLTTYLPLLEIHYNELFDISKELGYYRSSKLRKPLPILASCPASFFRLKPYGFLVFAERKSYD